jgi:MinD superfamily P-loop ATPase
MQERHVGQWFRSTTKTGSMMIHARLSIGAENSGKLVAKVKNEAKAAAASNNASIVLVDGSPGVSCPVVSSLSGAHFVALVTEPTVSGFHDLKRVLELVQKFQINTGCIINKSDLNPQITQAIEDFLMQERVPLISRLPYDEIFTKAMVNGKTIIEYSENHLSDILRDSWEKIKLISNREGK